MNHPAITLPEGQTFRSPAPGMGVGVLDRTYARVNADGTKETWGQVAHRVALGNVMLSPDGDEFYITEYQRLRRHIGQGSVLMSGRHLQHGDKDQPTKAMELFTNCSTAATSFALFYLLLNG